MAVKTAPAAAVCIALSKPPPLFPADALFQAHPPISRLIRGFHEPGHGRGSIQGFPSKQLRRQPSAWHYQSRLRCFLQTRFFKRTRPCPGSLRPAFILFFFQIRDNTRARACGSPCAACPCTGRGILNRSFCRRFRHILCIPGRRRPAC